MALRGVQWSAKSVCTPPFLPAKVYFGVVHLAAFKGKQKLESDILNTML